MKHEIQPTKIAVISGAAPSAGSALPTFHDSNGPWNEFPQREFALAEECKGVRVLNTGCRAPLEQTSESACFAMGTLVHTDSYDGCTEIEHIHVGDLVLARNILTGEQSYKPVINTFVHSDKQLFTLTYITNDGQKGYIASTGEHPFFVTDLGWVKALDLQPGHVLQICDPDGREAVLRPPSDMQRLALSGQRWTATVVSVETELRSMVFNIEVEEFHTYFVGVFGVLVHGNLNGQTTRFL